MPYVSFPEPHSKTPCEKIISLFSDCFQPRTRPRSNAIYYRTRIKEKNGTTTEKKPTTKKAQSI